MRRREIKRTKGSGSPRWMVTYSDMVTLILVFFILLFAMSQIDQVKFDALSQSFQERVIFDFLPSAVPMDNPSEGENSDIHNDLEDPLELGEIEDRDELATEVDSLTELLNDVETYLNEHDLNNVISANRTDRGVVLVLQESILFDSGEAYILDEGQLFLNHIGTLLQDIPNKVNVEGHTDSRPIANYRYPSNWELSGARASSVIRYLIEEHELSIVRFSAVGYADTRPIVPNTSPENWSQNRRVEIVILEAGMDNEEGMED